MCSATCSRVTKYWIYCCLWIMVGIYNFFYGFNTYKYIFFFVLSKMVLFFFIYIKLYGFCFILRRFYFYPNMFNMLFILSMKWFCFCFMSYGFCFIARRFYFSIEKERKYIIQTLYYTNLHFYPKWFLSNKLWFMVV